MHYVHIIWGTLILQHGIHLAIQIPLFGHQIGYILAGDLRGYCSDWRARDRFSSPESRYLQLQC